VAEQEAGSQVRKQASESSAWLVGGKAAEESVKRVLARGVGSFAGKAGANVRQSIARFRGARVLTSSAYLVDRQRDGESSCYGRVTQTSGCSSAAGCPRAESTARSVGDSLRGSLAGARWFPQGCVLTRTMSPAAGRRG